MFSCIEFVERVTSRCRLNYRMAPDVKRQIVNEIHRYARKNFERRKTDMIGIADTYQIDLVEMIPYARSNHDFKYILTAIDIFSKFAWAVPIKTKKGKDVTRAMSSILDTSPVPRNIHSDMGKEFYNAEFQQLMQRYGINHYSTFSTKKAAIVERFNRTLKNKMWRELHYNGSYKWIDLLDDIIDIYNHTKHRTIKMRPCDVNSDNEKDLLHSVYIYKNMLPLKHQFKVGDFVRISKYRSVFQKGYEPQWTTEIFSIAKVRATNPVTYLLRDYQGNEIEGGFYGPELQKVKYKDAYLVEKIVKKRGNRIFVKWLGFKDDHNSWIDINDLAN